MSKRTAIIDIGSNSIRMAVFEKSSHFAYHLIKEIKSRMVGFYKIYHYKELMMHLRVLKIL